MADIKKIKLGGVTYDIKDATTASALTAEVSRSTAYDVALSDRVSSLEQRGRYLSGWDATTHLPTTYPTIEVGETYTYKSGDYYIVTVTGTTNYKPSGTGITRTSEGYTVPYEAETAEVLAGDTYTYDGTNFVLTHSADNNQTVIVGTASFGPNDAVNFTAGSNIEVTANATNKSITIAASGLATSAELNTEATTRANADASLRADLSAEISARASADVALQTAIDGKLENVAIGSITGTVSAHIANFEAEEAGEFATLDKADVKTSAAASHVHSLTGTISGTGSISVPTISKTTKKLVTTSIVQANGSVSIIPAVSNGIVNNITLGDDTVASKVTTTAKTASKVTTTARTASKVTTAEKTVSKVTAAEDKVVVTAAIKSASCSQSFNTDAIKSANLTGTTTFVTGFGSAAYTAEYNTANECLELTALTPTTASVGISTSAATTVAVNIATEAAGTATVTQFTASDISFNAVGSCTDVACTEVSASDVSCSLVEASDVTVPVVSGTASVEVAKVGTAVNAAKLGTSVTVATGALDASGSGSELVDSITVGASEQSIAISTTLSGNTGYAGAHEHTIVDA